MSNSVNYPSISVVIPSFNQGQYIEETLLSVIGQQYPNLEILVIDGGSTDNTVEILEQYSSHISYWHSKPDKGQADAINQGMSLSSGDVVCWLNSDDMYLPGTLLDVGKRFIGRTNKSHLIYGAAVTIDESGKTLDSTAQTGAPFEQFRLTYLDFIVQPSSFWTRTLWEQTGNLNIKYNYILDWDWFIRASKLIEFEYIQKFYSIYRFHPLHKTSNGGAKRREEILEVVNKYSSKYWQILYSEVNRKYQIIKKQNDLMQRFRIPRRHSILPILFPKTMSLTKQKQDFQTVLLMYGI
ncbi:glycosyltransferase [Aetokthonos hydrillicola Thurmond2011]|jgi:glycosyltransferase involved in cell wall biosynthesis|uniref:Glycosyltransferase n=1 Tax=Aetokthonos hydrillicola Thurmond2011 TaxID=2712845 RepID=A0AAP5I445_9CYAN|nr:glycosyltransferase family 2 protein [Aetokthonos hydrillicola]MBO3457605.1 glycosyltransferase [Aetokthonos hydrillicola CCALA 1050]MBW4587883.1 glycosyltransferase [Aetokthonos hydrillicola CCALA 1050]MDR9894713.1 glycosyltransferase [Aetokthonos hydrillicola Thurmond2011]